MVVMCMVLIALAQVSEGPAQGPIETVTEGLVFTEGPVWVPGSGLLFSDIPADTIYHADKRVFRKPSNNSNGLDLDLEGRLLTAEHQARRISRTGKDGTITVVADRFEGKRFNSPNDLTVRSDGTIFFTDPPYGLEGGLGGPNDDLGFAGVFAVKPDGKVLVLAKDFKKPNGIACSPDEKTLYVADTEGEHIRAFDLAQDGSASNGRVFFELPSPDGLKVDTEGRVWATGGDSVWVIGADGKLIQKIDFPQKPANCAFGGEGGHTLFVTARTAVYKIQTTATGRIRP